MVLSPGYLVYRNQCFCYSSPFNYCLLLTAEGGTTSLCHREFKRLLVFLWNLFEQPWPSVLAVLDLESRFLL